jgi:hypothetical protein
MAAIEASASESDYPPIPALSPARRSCSRTTPKASFSGRSKIGPLGLQGRPGPVIRLRFAHRRAGLELFVETN